MGTALLLVILMGIRAIWWATDADRIKRGVAKWSKPWPHPPPLEHDHDMDVGDYQIVIRSRIDPDPDPDPKPDPVRVKNVTFIELPQQPKMPGDSP